MPECSECCGFRRARPDRAVSVEHVRACEINGVWLGVPLLLLMENAGKSVADAVDCRLGGVKGKTIHILAGKGGNAGDGFVAARHLARRGARVVVHLAYEPETITHSDTLLNYRILEKTGLARIVKPHRRGWLDLSGADVIIDAMLGVGVRGELRPPISEMAEAYNSAGGLKVSVDTPTGLDPDTGRASGNAVRSDITVTMGWEKRGFFQGEARLYTGEILVAEIGLPREAEIYAGPGDLRARIPKRPRTAHKGQGGRVVVIGGSVYYVGAPLLSAWSASRVGVDLVYLVAPRETAFTASSKCSTIIPRPFSSTILTLNDLDTIVEIAEKAHSLVVGPGLGLSEETVNAVARLLKLLEGKPVVIDADALKIVARKGLKLWPEAVLTPHRGEAALLLGAEKIGDPMEAAKAIASKYNCTVLLKGPEDYICDSSGNCRINRSGVPAMAVGGTGDILSGALAGIIARRTSKGLPPDTLNSAAAAAFLVGRAGELAYEARGESMIAGDLLETIPHVFKEADGLA